LQLISNPSSLETSLFRWQKASDRLARRRYQRGSLVRDDDRWIARFREDVLLPAGTKLNKDDKILPSGKVLRRIHKKEMLGTTQELPTKKLAERALAKRLEPINREDYRPTPVATFAEFAKRWQEKVMPHHKPSTQRSERSVIKQQLVPAFGGMALGEIRAEMLQEYVTSHPASPKTIRNIVVTMKTMWKTVKAWGYAIADPFDGLRLPTVVKGKVYYFTAEEMRAIIEKAQGQWKVLFRILGETHIRPGELAGLRTCDVGPQSLKIAQSVWQRKIQTPKTQNAVRSIAISSLLAAAVQQLIAERPANHHGLVFVAESGRPLEMDNFRHRILRPILEELGIRAKAEALGFRCGLYGFRHGGATLMDQIGVPMATRQARLGHAPGSEVTMRYYTHAATADDIAAADQIGALLSPGGMEATHLPEGVSPGILAHPAVQAEIARQVALALQGCS
jgi:integrase